MGSEMCIRDRLQPALRYGSGRSLLEKPIQGLFVRFANRSSPPPMQHTDKRKQPPCSIKIDLYLAGEAIHQRL